jgi:predicted ATPase/DNA-binding CsgD family transcriptional regulator
LRLAHGGPVAARQPLRSLDALPNNLPVALSSFVGRERELAELDRLLERERLVTLTGAGGCGKTRLALQAASESLERFPDGVWWVELAPLAEGELVGAAVAEVLGVRPLPGVTELQACGAWLASRQALVVLDNCEHLLEACAEAVESLLKAAPELLVLATSRAPLRADGETAWRVPSLSLPDLAATRGALARSEAVALFVERARNVQAGFSVTDDNAGSVARLCGELDGLPLAIELAAARVRMLSVEQIAAGVSHRFRLLTGGPRTAVPRLQTLRASVDWSHELLSEEERVLLRRLAVFMGGFTLEAVDEVCARDGIDGDQALDLLASLVDQSLVIAEEHERGVRYGLLETVRQYGLARLAAAGEEETLRGRHRDFFLGLAERAGPELETGRQRAWLELLDPEAANLVAAIDHALSTEPALALRFCAALYRWWCADGRFAEAELAFSRSLEAGGEREPRLRARALHARAYVAIWAGDFEPAERHATEALALANEVGDGGTSARARCQLGTALLFTNPRAARTELARAAELARTAGDDWALVTAGQITAATYVFQSDHVPGAHANDEIAALAERQGDPFQLARRWLWIATMAEFGGCFADARHALEQVRAAVDATGDPVHETLADTWTARLDTRQGEPERALECLHARLERTLKLGNASAVPLLLVGIAHAELATGRPEPARDRLEGLVPLIEGRDTFDMAWALCLLAEARRLLADPTTEATALRAQASAEQLGNRLIGTLARLTLGRLAAARGDWAAAQQHALAHLDACAEGGHACYIPDCLDVLGELAAGLHAHEDAVRLFAVAERARAEIGIVRFPPEENHWAAIDQQLRETLGPEAYEQARSEGAELAIDDAIEWARRARGPRRRPPRGWGSLTPTEAKVAELVAAGLTNPQISERMFVSKATVKTHLAHIFSKLDVHTRAELSAEAVRRDTPGGSLPPP